MSLLAKIILLNFSFTQNQSHTELKIPKKSAIITLVADYLVAHYVDHKEVGLIVRHTEDMHLLVAEGPVGQHLVLLVRYDRMVRLGTGHLGAERTDLCHNPWEVVERTD